MASVETSSKIDIISRALVLCGEKPLNSLNDNRYGATVGSALYETLYESELQSNPWRFSMTKKALSRLVDAPLNQWQFAYQLPSDMLILRGVYPVDLNYEVYGDHLYSDRSSVEAEYQFKPDITSAPAYFVELLVVRLASYMIKPITESDQAVKLMEDKYRQQRARAQYADAQARPAKKVFHSPFTNVRGGR